VTTAAQLPRVNPVGPTAPSLTARLTDAVLRRPLLALLTAGLLLGLRRSESPYGDGDILWGTRAGMDFLASGTIPRTDSYSWTAHGTKWIPNDWGWDVLLGVAYKLAGASGIALLGVVVAGVLAVLIGANARRAGASTAWSSLVFLIIAGVFALFLYPRAQLADYVAIFLLPLLVPTVLFGNRESACRAAALTLFVQVIWMNLHTTAVIGPVLIAAFGIGRLGSPAAAGNRRAVTGRLCGLVALAAAGCLGTPYGTAPLTHLEAVRRASVGLVAEWRPVGLSSPGQLLGMGALVLAAAAALLAWRAQRIDTALTLAVLAAGTATAIRFAPMTALYSVPELAAVAGRLPARPRFVNRIYALALAVFALMCLVGVRGFAEPGVANTSPRLVSELPSGCRLLNDYGIGGAVILRRPDVPVSIDSRNDLYGRAAELQSLSVLGDPKFGLEYVESHEVTCVLVQSHAPLVGALERTGQWRVARSDAVRTLLIPTARR
jgi:hypothetical protein